MTKAGGTSVPLVVKGIMYGIREDYVQRVEGVYDEEIGMTSRWQGQVYEIAGHLAQAYRYSSILDIGCGRAFKLLQHFDYYATLGLDLQPTVDWLKANYPAREWRAIDYTNPPQGYDLVIVADVIEHVSNPDALLSFIIACKPKKIVLSTPDRDLLEDLFYAYYRETDPTWDAPNGPPFNKCHLREWSFDEFDRYVAQRLVIERHVHAPREQACQCVIARTV